MSVMITKPLFMASVLRDAERADRETRDVPRVDRLGQVLGDHSRADPGEVDRPTAKRGRHLEHVGGQAGGDDEVVAGGQPRRERATARVEQVRRQRRDLHAVAGGQPVAGALDRVAGGVGGGERLVGGGEELRGVQQVPRRDGVVDAEADDGAPVRRRGREGDHGLVGLGAGPGAERGTPVGGVVGHRDAGVGAAGHLGAAGAVLAWHDREQRDVERGGGGPRGPAEVLVDDLPFEVVRLGPGHAVLLGLLRDGEAGSPAGCYALRRPTIRPVDGSTSKVPWPWTAIASAPWPTYWPTSGWDGLTGARPGGTLLVGRSAVAGPSTGAGVGCGGGGCCSSCAFNSAISVSRSASLASRSALVGYAIGHSSVRSWTPQRPHLVRK